MGKHSKHLIALSDCGTAGDNLQGEEPHPIKEASKLNEYLWVIKVAIPGRDF